MTASAATLTVVMPVVVALLGLLFSRPGAAAAREWAVLGGLAGVLAAGTELYQVVVHGPVEHIGLLGRADLGFAAVRLDLRADQLTASVALAVAVVAACVQLYSTAYLRDEGTPTEPTRYPAFAATVSLFTAAMMLVVHADDLLVLLVGWEVMGLCSYLLVGHHSERPAARAAAMKAFLVTRVGDVGVLLGVIVLLVGAGTSSISTLLAHPVDLPRSTVTAAALLLLLGVLGKSAQFPLHTWLPDAMEGPTPASALIHAATMVAAGVFLVARLLPLFLYAQAALTVAAVVASITMLGAALAALAQDDLKRLLAWSTISQVAYMLAGVSVATSAGDAGPGVLHLLSHAAFKALLFLVAGCVIHLAGSDLLVDMGGLARLQPRLAALFGLGLAALAGLPPLGGFWSKEAVLTAAESAALAGDGGWPPRLVLACGLLTTLVTGVYAGRAYAMVVMGEPSAALFDPDDPEEVGVGHGADGYAFDDPRYFPVSMRWPLLVLALPTLGLGLVLVNPPDLLLSVHVDVLTAFTGTLLSLAGVGWALTAPRLGVRDVADAMPVPVRAFLRDGYRLDVVTDRLVVRPYRAVARWVAEADLDVVDAVPRALAGLTRLAGAGLRPAGTGVATGYLVWLVAGTIALVVVGVSWQ